jgi:phosphohistidine phosphatase
MKTLLIMRHAKTQPDAPNGDHARELTGRGRRDATTIGLYISSLVGTPDAIVTSDATRALETAELVATSCQFTSPLTVEPGVYGAAAAELAEIVRQFPDTAACVLLVGHNPGMHDLIGLLSDADVPVDHVPTAAVARLEHDSAQWQDFTPGSCRFREMISPRLLTEQNG